MNKQIISQLQFAVDNNYNVLLIGEAGVGKTAVIKQIFEEKNLNYLYFSAATMDAFVDFIGVPEVQNENGVKYIELIPPKAFAFDNIHALFFDEFNRAPAKVRNACLELIQFRSINGKKFNNLKMVWAAINPKSDNDDGSNRYDVEQLDPAQIDRFDFHIEIPYELNVDYFKTKFPDHASAAMEWWNALPDEQKSSISPRRLDKALQVFTDGGDLSWVLPRKSNISVLAANLKYGSFSTRLKNAFTEKNDEDATNLINDKNLMSKYIKHILTNKEMMDYFLQFATDERIAALVDNEKVLDWLTSPEVSKNRLNLIESIYKSRSVKAATLEKLAKILIDSARNRMPNPLNQNIPKDVMDEFSRIYKKDNFSTYQKIL